MAAAATVYGGLRRSCRHGTSGRKWHKKGKKTNLFKIAKKKGKPRLASGVWDKALKTNDKMAHKLIDRAIWALGAGIASAVNLTDVQAVIIGGGLWHSTRPAVRGRHSRRDDAKPHQAAGPASRVARRTW